MKHYGDITKIDGHKVPLVDIVTGGSPCQDLSVAGKRAGLDGERSGLFMEQIRIVKEMRDESRQLCMRGADEYIRPRYLVWENVPGAFSSNKGRDFQAVLTEIVRIVDPTVPDVPLPKNGKWSKSGCLMGYGEDGQPFSIAYRLHDAQFWGVPQRRKRISLIADFGGTSAPEILFERESLPRDTESGGETRETTARPVERNIAPSSYTLKIRGGVDRDSNGKSAGKGALIQTELSGTLGVSQDQTLITGCLNPWDVQSKHIQPTDGKAEALYSGECRYGGGESYVMCSSDGDIAGTLDASYYKGCGVRRDRERTVVCVGNVPAEEPHEVCYGLDRASFNQGKNALYDFSVEEETAQTLVAKGPGGGVSETVGALCARDFKGVGSQYVDEHKVIVQDT